MSQMLIRPLVEGDRPWVQTFIADHWGADYVVAHGRIYYPHELTGYVALTGAAAVGLVTYHLADGDCEIVTLNSLQSGQGTGSALIEAVKTSAVQSGCRRLWLITTNDNLPALAFYQKRGFVLVTVHRGAVARSRQVKPSISMAGYAGIPLRDEIELEILLP